MPSVEASQSRAEASRLPYIARPAALIVAILLISWLIGLSDVGTASVLLGASTVVLMVSLLGFGYWRAMSRAEEQTAITEPQTDRLTRSARMRAAWISRAARAERREALTAFRLTEIARQAAYSDIAARHSEMLEAIMRESVRRQRESERDHEQRSRESWAELAQEVGALVQEVEPPPRRRRGHRRPKGELATTDRP
jgi:hypothetical protein